MSNKRFNLMRLGEFARMWNWRTGYAPNVRPDGGSMNETMTSLRAYFALVGIAAAYSAVVGLPGRLVGLLSALRLSDGIPEWFRLLWLAGPILGLVAAAVFLYLALQLPTLIAARIQSAQRLVIVAAALVVAKGCVDFAVSGAWFSLAASLVGLVVIWYLHRSIGRLGGGLAADRTSAST